MSLLRESKLVRRSPLVNNIRAEFEAARPRKNIQKLSTASTSNEHLQPRSIEPVTSTSILPCQFKTQENIPGYHYKPLDSTRKSIRLLRILPGGPNETVFCAIEHHDLSTLPNYTALSYTWDHNKEQAWIDCDGINVQVGQNLLKFLQQFRKSSGSLDRRLWIDALCINQHDVQERNHQVAQMRDIYQGASAVIAWLGDETGDDADAFGLLHDSSVSTSRTQEAWYRLFSKPYWRRVWIIQEFILGKKAFIWCGDLQADAADFKNTGEKLDWVHTVRGTPGWRLLILRDLWRTNSRYEPTRFGLHKLSTSFAMSKSTDPRDFVYAFLGIAVSANGRSIPITPDYDKSVDEVLVDVIKNLYYIDISGEQLGEKIGDPTTLEDSKWDQKERYQDFIRHLSSKLDVGFERGERHLLEHGPEARALKRRKNIQESLTKELRDELSRERLINNLDR